MVKLNLGCGFNKLDGYVDVDKSPACELDPVVDLELLPWPFADNAAEEVRMVHLPEHLGAAPEVFLGVIQELYRVCRHDARVIIVVPHPRHDALLADPTHVRPILPHTLQLFSKAMNREWQEKGVPNTPPGLYLDVDFEIEKVDYVLDEWWQAQIEQGKLIEAEPNHALRTHNNVAIQIECRLRVVKEDGPAA